MRALFLASFPLFLLLGCTDPDFRDAGDSAVPEGPLCSGRTCDAGDSDTGIRNDATSPGGDASDATGGGDGAVTPFDPMDAPDASDADGSVPGTNGMLSDEERAMVGKYAVRARFYARGVPAAVTFAHDILMRADIHADASGAALSMDVFLCQDACTIKAPPLADSYSAISNPDSWPTRTYSLQVAGNKFYTTGPALPVGYKAGTPAGCENGAASTNASAQQQSWLSTGQCTCPASNAPPPKSVADCRVIDGDNDGRAATSLSLTGSDGKKQTVLLRLLESSQIIDGLVSADGKHTAQYNKAEDYWVLQCESEPCLNSDYAYCPTALQPVLFERLSDAEFTCPTVLAHTAGGQFFDRAPLQFPSGC